MVFISPSRVSQIAVATVIAFAFVLVSEGLNPYESKWDSWVSHAGNIVVLRGMYVTLLIRVEKLSLYVGARIGIKLYRLVYFDNLPFQVHRTMLGNDRR